jgi:hypothetical protein
LTTLDGSRSLHLGVVHIMRPVVIPSQMLARWIGPARPPFAYAAAHGIALRADGSEVQVRRPKAGRPGRREFVSGKKRQNTLKFTKISDERGRTLWDGAFRPGRMHDQTAVKTEGIDTLLSQFPQVKFEMDSGYGGLRRDRPAQVSIGVHPAAQARQGRAGRRGCGLAAGPPRPVIGTHLRRARHRRLQALAAPATLDRATRRPARNHPGHRLAGLRPGRCLVKPEPSRRQARTPRT